MFEIKFLKATAERAVKTFVQTLLALVGTDAAGVLSVDLAASLQVAGAATLLSVLTSFASSGVGKSGPSLAGETTDSTAAAVAAVTAAVVSQITDSVTAPAKPAAKKPAAKKAAAKPKKPTV